MLLLISIATLIVLPLVASNCVTKTHDLEAFLVSNPSHAHLVWSDRFGTAEGDFSCYEPNMDLLSPSWKLLGHHPQPNHHDVEGNLYAFRPCKDKALVPPVGFTLIWDDGGTTHFKDVSLWRPNCPVGYSALSDFFYPENGVASPAGLFDKVRCVRDDLAEPCGKGNIVWKFRGISKQVSVWYTAPASTALGGPFLYGNPLAGAPPGIQYKCLKKTSFITL